MFAPDEIPTFVVDLPDHVPGLSCMDEDGTPIIYLNARHSSEKNRNTYEHELTHIQRDDFNNCMPTGLVEAINASAPTPAEVPTLVPPAKPVISDSQPVKKAEPIHLFLSGNLQQEAERLFGLSPYDQRWPAILFAMLITGSQENKPTRKVTRTYFFHPVKVWKGAMYQMTGKRALKQVEQRQFLYPYNCYS